MTKLRPGLSMLCAAATIASLAGCHVRSEPVLTSSAAPVGQFHEVSLLLENEGPATRSMLRSALSSELSSRNVSVLDGAQFVGDFSVSSSNAEVPLYTSEAGQSEIEPVAIVVARESSWTDSCTAVRTRATFAVYRVDDGALVNRSIAEAIVCEGDALPYEGLAKALVDGVTGP